jgi:hypothetical protein
MTVCARVPAGAEIQIAPRTRPSPLGKASSMRRLRHISPAQCPGNALSTSRTTSSCAQGKAVTANSARRSSAWCPLGQEEEKGNSADRGDAGGRSGSPSARTEVDRSHSPLFD